MDYLVVNEADLKGSGPPTYFEPFDTRARALWGKRQRDKPFILPELAKKAGVYSRDGIDIILICISFDYSFAINASSALGLFQFLLYFGIEFSGA